MKHKIKQVGFLVAGILSINPVIAEHGPSTLKGPYAGLSLGVAHMNTPAHADFQNANNTSDFKYSDTNIAGNIRLGWTFPTSSKLLLGLEGTAGLSALKDENFVVVSLGNAPNRQVKTTFKERYNFGAAAKIGYMVQPSMFGYLKLGVRFSNFRFTYQDYTNGNPGTENSLNKTRAGFEPGLGVMVKLNSHWSFNAEYSHTFYRANTVLNADNLGNTTYPTVEYRPRVGRVMVGMNYHF